MNPVQRETCQTRAGNIIREAILAQSDDQNRVAMRILVLDSVAAGVSDAARLTRLLGMEPYRAELLLNLLADA